jgi:TRAP-type uncharacterized transport system substrate-binding protein
MQLEQSTNFCNPLYYKSEDIDTTFYSIDNPVTSLESENTQITSPDVDTRVPGAVQEPTSSNFRKFRVKKKALRPVEDSEKENRGLVAEDEL